MMSDKPIYKVSKEKGRLEAVFSSTMENIDNVAEEVKILLKEADLERYSFGVRIVLREGLTNAVRHGNRNHADKLVRFELIINKNLLTMTIEDEGDGFDWKSVRLQTPSDADDHGRGVPIIEEYFDEYSYNLKGNILTLKKDISA